MWEGVALEKMKDGQCDWSAEGTGELNKVEGRRQSPHPHGAGP